MRAPRSAIPTATRSSFGNGCAARRIKKPGARPGWWFSSLLQLVRHHGVLGAVAVIHVHRRIGLADDLEDAEQALAGAREGVVDEHVLAGILGIELADRSAAWRHAVGLQG